MSVGNFYGDFFQQENDELDIIIRNLEHENQQFVRLLEKENQIIEAIEVSIVEKQDAAKSLDDSVTRLNEETKRAHKQFIQNRDQCESLKKTYTLLCEHECILHKKMENMEEKDKIESEQRDSILQHYKAIWDDYENQYQQFPLAKELQKETDELEEAKKSMEELIAQFETMQTNIEKQKKLKENEEFIQTMEKFVVKMADIKVDTNKVIQELNFKNTNIADMEKEIQELDQQKADRLKMDQLRSNQQLEQVYVHEEMQEDNEMVEHNEAGMEDNDTDMVTDVSTDMNVIEDRQSDQHTPHGVIGKPIRIPTAFRQKPTIQVAAPARNLQPPRVEVPRQLLSNPLRSFHRGPQQQNLQVESRPPVVHTTPHHHKPLNMPVIPKVFRTQRPASPPQNVIPRLLNPPPIQSMAVDVQKRSVNQSTPVIEVVQGKTSSVNELSTMTLSEGGNADITKSQRCRIAIPLHQNKSCLAQPQHLVDEDDIPVSQKRLPSQQQQDVCMTVDDRKQEEAVKKVYADRIDSSLPVYSTEAPTSGKDQTIEQSTEYVLSLTPKSPFDLERHLSEINNLTAYKSPDGINFVTRPMFQGIGVEEGNSQCHGQDIPNARNKTDAGNPFLQSFFGGNFNESASNQTMSMFGNSTTNNGSKNNMEDEPAQGSESSPGAGFFMQPSGTGRSMFGDPKSPASPGMSGGDFFSSKGFNFGGGDSTSGSMLSMFGSSKTSKPTEGGGDFSFNFGSDPKSPNPPSGQSFSLF